MHKMYIEFMTTALNDRNKYEEEEIKGLYSTTLIRILTKMKEKGF